ncbi:chorismate mutase [Actinopolymorpha sp. NPDC004070]|uniref:chorismate mutase n=1 Tax=Actinopolymorpha sp. NPDC004070 TaxID=3154548 RepID=UPI00339F0FAE
MHRSVTDQPVAALTARPLPASLPEARAAIDEVDAALAALLEYRAGLTAQVQHLKPVGGRAGRDPDRETEIVAGMARRAPRLGAKRLRRIMTAVIEESLDLAERGAATTR